jgi:hypothetical protein
MAEGRHDSNTTPQEDCEARPRAGGESADYMALDEPGGDEIGGDLTGGGRTANHGQQQHKRGGRETSADDRGHLPGTLSPGGEAPTGWTGGAATTRYHTAATPTESERTRGPVEWWNACHGPRQTAAGSRKPEHPPRDLPRGGERATAGASTDQV